MLLHLRAYAVSIMTFAAIVYLSFFRPPRVEPLEQVIGFDKLVHALMYGFLAFVIGWEYRRDHRVRPLLPRRLWVFSAALPIGLGLAIEILQGTLTAYRSCDVWDFVADTIGVLLACLVARRVFRKPSSPA